MPLGRASSVNNPGTNSQIGIRSTQDYLADKERLKKQIQGNSNLASKRVFKDVVGLADYVQGTQSYQLASAAAGESIGLFDNLELEEGATLDDFKALNKKIAGYRPGNFNSQYGTRSTNLDLADFEKDQAKYWKEQENFMSINTDKLLTKQLEANYKNLIAMEDDYKSMIESGDVIGAYKLKDRIERFKAEIDAVKAQRIQELS